MWRGAHITVCVRAKIEVQQVQFSASVRFDAAHDSLLIFYGELCRAVLVNASKRQINQHKWYAMENQFRAFEWHNLNDTKFASVYVYEINVNEN